MLFGIREDGFTMILKCKAYPEQPHRAILRLPACAFALADYHRGVSIDICANP
ncbi:hypothetical protein SAMN04487894_102249 [Niabella drilacis]|uniref:Uncharacterized protein n=1 Tax=Niabella drilacis (strain DSM 25811 / CCM 8410 / CCUG 62505 / LMG 26954 / E90) TaxID=1285928 RepID=A0A1G6L7Z9_NIADE|nr:hypothetical protein SAMN04487894_102249 [Niabella drilacis]